MQVKQKKDHYKIIVTILVVAFSFSLSVTIILATFTANKTGDVTLTFANGLTMSLTPLGTSGRIQITAAGVDAATFSYTPVSNSDDQVFLDGIQATINKDAWISYRIEVFEIISGNAVAPPGSWRTPTEGSKYTQFYPNVAPSNWQVSFYSGTGNFYPQLDNSNANALIVSSSTICAASSSPLVIMGYVLFRGHTDQNYVNDLSGRSFEVHFIIKARTDEMPTF